MGWMQILLLLGLFLLLLIWLDHFYLLSQSGKWTWKWERRRRERAREEAINSCFSSFIIYNHQSSDGISLLKFSLHHSVFQHSKLFNSLSYHLRNKNFYRLLFLLSFHLALTSWRGKRERKVHACRWKRPYFRPFSTSICQALLQYWVLDSHSCHCTTLTLGCFYCSWLYAVLVLMTPAGYFIMLMTLKFGVPHGCRKFSSLKESTWIKVKVMKVYDWMHNKTTILFHNVPLHLSLIVCPLPIEASIIITWVCAEKSQENPIYLLDESIPLQADFKYGRVYAFNYARAWVANLNKERRYSDRGYRKGYKEASKKAFLWSCKYYTLPSSQPTHGPFPLLAFFWFHFYPPEA